MVKGEGNDEEAMGMGEAVFATQLELGGFAYPS